MSIGQDDPRRTGDEARAAGDAVEKSVTEASGGVKTGHIRWVLAVGLVLVVIVLGATWLSFASRPKSEVGAAASRPVPVATLSSSSAG